MSKEALKLALEALEKALRYHGVMLLSDPPQDAWKYHRVEQAAHEAITALREALAEQPAPENFIDALKYDVARRDFWEGYVPEPDKRQQALDKKAENARELGLDYEPRAWFTVDELNAWADKKLEENPQWAEQPAQRTWVGLTDEQIKDVAASCMWWVREQDILEDAIEFARAIEATLREQNT